MCGIGSAILLLMLIIVIYERKRKMKIEFHCPLIDGTNYVQLPNGKPCFKRGLIHAIGEQLSIDGMLHTILRVCPCDDGGVKIECVRSTTKGRRLRRLCPMKKH